MYVLPSESTVFNHMMLSVPSQCTNHSSASFMPLHTSKQLSLSFQQTAQDLLADATDTCPLTTIQTMPHMAHARPTPQEGFWLDGGEIHPYSYVSSVSFHSRLSFSSFYLATSHQNIAVWACTHTHAHTLSFPLSWPPQLVHSVLVPYIKPLAWLQPGRLSYPIQSVMQS